MGYDLMNSNVNGNGVASSLNQLLKNGVLVGNWTLRAI